MRIPVYRKSILATLISIVSALTLAYGVVMVVSSVYLTGIILIVVSVGLFFAGLFLGKTITEAKVFRKWKKQIKAEGLEEKIKIDTVFALKVYNMNPDKRTLNYIKSLNPEAAEYIIRNSN